MTTLFPDTRPETGRVQIELLRYAPARRKLDMVGHMNYASRTLALSGLRQRYPHARPEEVRRRLTDLLPGPGPGRPGLRSLA